MLLHTKLINVLRTVDKEVKVESGVFDTTASLIDKDKTKTLFEGKKNISTIVAVIEEEVDNLESLGYEPYITVYDSNEKFDIHQPLDEIMKTEEHFIKLYFY